MKKKTLTKEEKKERNLKILKICLYGGGLLLCAGAFVSLLVIGIRGCAATPRSSSNENTEVAALPDSINNVRRDSVIAEYESYVWLSQYYYDEAPEVTIVNSYVSNTYNVGGYINDVRFERVVCARGMIGGSYANGMSFYAGESSVTSQGTKVAGYEYHIIGGGLDMLTTTTENLNVGDVVRFEKGEALNNMKLNDNFINAYYAGFWGDYEDKSILFNNQINRYSPLNQDNAVFAVGGVAYRGEKVIFKGLFKDENGQLYKDIKITYADGDGSGYTTNGIDYYVNNNGSNTIMFINLMYNRVNEMSSSGVDTEYITTNRASYTAVGEHYPVYTNGSIWASAYFQRLQLLYVEDYHSALPSGNLSPVDVLSGFNNLNNTTGVTGGGSIGSTSPFALIGSAFSSLLPLFNVYLWPGVTIGVLLFIPLVASIVLFVVWLFKR